MTSRPQWHSASTPPGLLTSLIEQLGLRLPDGELPMRQRLAQLSGDLIGYHSLRIGQHRWRVFVLHAGDVWIQVGERTDARAELSAKLGWATGAPLLIGLLAISVDSAAPPMP